MLKSAGRLAVSSLPLLFGLSACHKAVACTAANEATNVVPLRDQRKKILRGGVVGTLMSNLGLEHALQRENIEFQRAAVG